MEPIPITIAPPAESPRSWRLSDLVVVLALEYLVWLTVHWLLAGIDDPSIETGWSAREIAADIAAAAFVVGSVAWIATTEHGGLTELRMARHASSRTVFLGVVGGIAMAFAGGLTEGLVQSLFGLGPTAPSVTGPVRWDQLLSLVLVPAISEETYFRGLAYVTFSKRSGSKLTGAVLASGFFAATHGYDVSGTTTMLVFGLLLTVVLEYARSLEAAMIAHATCNGVVVLAAVQTLS